MRKMLKIQVKCEMLLVIAAILAVVVIFMILGALVIATSKNEPKPNHKLLSKRYSYRSEPHADQTTMAPNQLRDNPVSDVEEGVARP